MATIPLFVCALIAGAPYAVDTTGTGNVKEELIPLASAGYSRMADACLGKGCGPIKGDFIGVTTTNGQLFIFRIDGALQDAPLSEVIQNCLAS